MGFFVFIIWIILSGIIGSLGAERNIGGVPAFLISLLLSPLVGLIVVLVSDKKKGRRAGSKSSNVEDFNIGVKQSKLEEYKGNKEKAIDLIKEALFFAEEEQKIEKKFSFRYNAIDKEKLELLQRMKKLEQPV